MNASPLSPATQVTLLLCSPLRAGRNKDAQPLSTGEFNELEKQLQRAPSLVTVPRSPPAVATSSPLASASIIARCSFCFFICGRIITKYSTTNISTSGSMPVSDDIMSPPAAAAAGAGAVWAKAEEMNTADSRAVF